MSADLPSVVAAALLLVGTAAADDRPRILFLGDPIHRGIVTAAANELEGLVELHVPNRPPANSSRTVLEHLDELLGKGEWDLIYFNFGLGDLFHRDPNTREIRSMSRHAGGVPVSSPGQYEKNLDRIVDRLKGSDAKLLWGSTTPLIKVDFFPGFKGNLYEPGSEVAYNIIAARVMKRHRIPVVDLHAHAMKHFTEDENHPPYPKYSEALEKKGHPLHAPLAEAFRTELGLD